MTEREATTTEDLKRYWYNRWKEGFSWFETANTLRTGAYNTRDVFLSAEQHFLQDFWRKAKVHRDGDGLHVKSNFSDTYDPTRNAQMDLYRVYMGQVGSAIENLLKGIIICGMWLDDHQSIDGVEDFKNLSFPVNGSATQTMGIQTHDLIGLLSARNMRLAFSDKEKEIMKKLGDFVTWGGRYTSPVKYNAGDEPTFMKTMSPIDEPNEHEVIEKIYHTAAEELVRLSSLQRDQRD